MKYEELYIEIETFAEEDVITASGDEEEKLSDER